MAIRREFLQRVQTALLIGLLTGLVAPAWACRVCRPRVQAAIHAPDYTQNIALVLLPVGVLLLLGLGLFFASSFTRRFTSSSPVHG